MNTRVEKKITYKLIKVKNSRPGHDVYRAVLQHDALTPEETLDEIAADLGLPGIRIESMVNGALSSMVRHTLEDGRTRKFGDWFETRLDIEGNFERIDAPFEPDVHKAVVNILPLAKVGRFKRTMPPENERMRPRGRIDYVTYPGGDKGEIKIGEDILVYGHDLTISDHDTLLLKLEMNGESQNFIAHLYTYPDEEPKVIEHDDTHIRLKWFGPDDSTHLTKTEGMFYVITWTRDKRKPWQNPSRGSSAHVRIVS